MERRMDPGLMLVFMVGLLVAVFVSFGVVSNVIRANKPGKAWARPDRREIGFVVVALAFVAILFSFAFSAWSSAASIIGVGIILSACVGYLGRRLRTGR
jgi:hypothetical protein